MDWNPKDFDVTSDLLTDDVCGECERCGAVASEVSLFEVRHLVTGETGKVCVDCYPEAVLVG